GHFRFGALQLSIGTLKGSGTGAEGGMVEGCAGGGLPIIQPGSDAGGPLGEVFLNAQAEDGQAADKDDNDNGPFQLQRPIEPKQRKHTDAERNEPAGFGA